MLYIVQASWRSAPSWVWPLVITAQITRCSLLFIKSMPTVNLREFVQSTKLGGHMYEINACCYKSLGYIYTWPSCLQRVGVLCTIAASHPSLSIYLCVKHEKFILIDSCLKCPINFKFLWTAIHDIKSGTNRFLSVWRPNSQANPNLIHVD